MSKLTELHTLDMWVLFYFFKPHLYIHEAAIKAHRVKDMKHRFPQLVLTVEAPGATESPYPWSPTQGVHDAPGQLCFLQGRQEFSGSGNGKPSYQIGDS